MVFISFKFGRDGCFFKGRGFGSDLGFINIRLGYLCLRIGRERETGVRFLFF